MVRASSNRWQKDARYYIYRVRPPSASPALRDGGQASWHAHWEEKGCAALHCCCGRYDDTLDKVSHSVVQFKLESV